MHARDDNDTNLDIDRRQDEFRTESLDLAAWLVSQGFPLQRLDPPDDSAQRPHAWFIFPRTGDLTEAVSTWESGQPILGTDLRRYISVKKDLFGRARRVVSREGGGR